MQKATSLAEQPTLAVPLQIQTTQTTSWYTEGPWKRLITSHLLSQFHDNCFLPEDLTETLLACACLLKKLKVVFHCLDIMIHFQVHHTTLNVKISDYNIPCKTPDLFFCYEAGSIIPWSQKRSSHFLSDRQSP